MNIQTLAKEMSKLGVIFDKVITKELIAAYEDILKDLTDQQIIDASYKWQTEGKFFPRPSELLDMIQTPEQSSGEAWALVLKEFRDHENANLPDHIMVAINEIGGIKALAHMPYSQLEFKFKEFKAVYTPDRLGELKERLDHDPQFKALGELIGRDL